MTISIDQLSSASTMTEVADELVAIADANRPTITGALIHIVASYLDHHPDARALRHEVLLVHAVIARCGDNPQSEWPPCFARALTERVGERALREAGLTPLQVREVRALAAP